MDYGELSESLAATGLVVVEATVEVPAEVRYIAAEIGVRAG